MKNLKHLFTALLLLCATAVAAHDFEVGGIYYNILAVDNTVQVTYLGSNYYDYTNEYAGSVVIPESVTHDGSTYSVTSIGDYAFFYCIDLTSVEIPNSVTSIGEFAFQYCSGLTNVVIGNSVTSIGKEAFYGCTSLKIVYNNSSLDITVGSSKHGHLGSYAAVVVNKNDILEKVGNFTFHKTDSTVTLVDYTGVDNVISLPASYNGENYAIGKKLFFEKSNIASVFIPNSVTSIGSSAFSACSGLISIEIPNSVTSIGSSAFGACSGLTSIEIPNSVTSIGSSAFSDCIRLTSVEIGNGVTSIGDDAFNNCTDLKMVYVSDLTAWCGIDFVSDYANPLKYAHNLYLNGELVTELVIPDGVKEIKNYAFIGCSSLTSVEIPNSVTSIGEKAFYYGVDLTSITSLIPADSLFAPGYRAFFNVNCTLYVPYGAKETYASTEGWNEFANIVELEPTEVTVTIGQYGSATYCSPYSLDFSEVEGLKAYAATGYNKATQVVTLTRVQTTEAGVGLFLKGEPGEYVVPVIEYSNDYTLNLLVGTLEQTTVNSTDGAMSNYKFTIADGDAAPMFYPFKDNTTLSAGKAYLQIPTAWLPVTAQKSLNIRFDEGETTDIDELKGESGEVKTIYDLQGRVVENPTSGIYIIGGKKVIIK